MTVKIRRKTKVIYVNPYRQQCLVVIGGGIEELIACCREMEGIPAKRNLEYIEKHKGIVKESTDGTTYPLPYGFAITLKTEDVGVIVHECTHLALMTLNRVGVPVTLKNQEAIAYLIQDLVEQILHK